MAAANLPCAGLIGARERTRRMSAVVLGIAVLAGCGARSGLDVLAGEPEVEPPVVGDCPAALLPGAPAPVPGYCPTRANRSAFPAPTAVPETKWTLDLPVAFDSTGQWIVAPGGRLYTRADPNPGESAALMLRRLIAIDDRADGAQVAWTLDFDIPITEPLLLADGSLLTSTRTSEGREVLWIDEGGAIARRAAVPDDVSRYPAVGADGSLYFLAWNVWVDPSVSSIVATDAQGQLRWRSPPLQPRGAYGLALGRDDQPIVGDARGTDAWVVALDPATGSLAWETMLATDAPIIDGPAIGRDGSIHMVLWTEASAKTTLFVLEPDGAIRRRVDLPDPPWGGGATSLSVGADGTAYIKAGEGYVAIDAAGELRFRRTVHPNVPIVTTIDARGVPLLTNGTIEALDPTDGTTLWLFDPPAHQEPTPGGGAVFYFPGPATLGDGALFFTDSGGRAYAVAGPGSR